MLEDIPDAEDKICKYNFDHINKWMPLVYYDQIKARNTVETEESTNNSLPFFLDFNNIDEQKKKILGDIEAELEEKKK